MISWMSSIIFYFFRAAKNFLTTNPVCATLFVDAGRSGLLTSGTLEDRPNFMPTPKYDETVKTLRDHIPIPGVTRWENHIFPDGNHIIYLFSDNPNPNSCLPYVWRGCAHPAMFTPEQIAAMPVVHVEQAPYES